VSPSSNVGPLGNGRRRFEMRGGAAHAVLENQPLPERHRERVEHISSGGEHLLRLIDDVLDPSRIGVPTQR